jgi:hypothetical protein
MHAIKKNTCFSYVMIYDNFIDLIEENLMMNKYNLVFFFFKKKKTRFCYIF